MSKKDVIKKALLPYVPALVALVAAIVLLIPGVTDPGDIMGVALFIMAFLFLAIFISCFWHGRARGRFWWLSPLVYTFACAIVVLPRMPGMFTMILIVISIPSSLGLMLGFATGWLRRRKDKK